MNGSKTAGGELWIAPDCAALFARHRLHTLDDIFAVEAARRLDKATLPPWRERVMLELADTEGQKQRLFVKRFQSPPASARARTRAPACSVAGVERHWVTALTQADIPVPRIAAFGEEVRGGREVRSVLVLADVGGISLETMAAHADRPAPRQLVEGVADLVRRLHRAGFIHRDLYLSHVFLTNNRPRTPELALIDLQRVMQRPWRWRRWQARDLAQLAYSTPQHVAGRTARLRFLRRYLEGVGLHSRAARAIMRRVLRKSAQIAAHDARVRARLAAGAAQEMRAR